MQTVYVVDGARTPFIKAKNQRGPFSAADLAVAAGRDLLARHPFSSDRIDEVVVGCMNPSEDEANIGRIIAMRLGCGEATPGWTVQRNCASGMQALDSAMKDIALGRHDLVLAGGTEAMSRSPLLFRPEMVNWFSRMMGAKHPTQKLQNALRFRPRFLSPIIALMRGLTDPLCGFNMGQTAEMIAYQYGITRAQMDAFATDSHHKVAAAQDDGLFPSIVPLYGPKGNYYDSDDGVRRDSNTEKLAKLRPVFDKWYGMVTAGNSSQVTDGACMLLLASERAVEEHGLSVLGKIVDAQWSGLDPRVMGLGPTVASGQLLQRQSLGLEDVDYWEINEAFAAQVLGCIDAFDDESFCQAHFSTARLGKLDAARLNVSGGAIAMGHPVGASGARIVLQLLHTLHQKEAKRGIASLCIGGGQGGAMLLERV